MRSLRAEARELAAETGWTLERCRNRLRRGSSADAIKEDAKSGCAAPAPWAAKAAWIEAQREKPCADCGHTYPIVCMDFHHRDPTLKRFTIGNGLSRSMEALRLEVSKCDVICANCHRIRHAGRRLSTI